MFKKKISAAISVLLCVLLLGGCALDSLFEFDRADFTAKEICRFDDMEYVRPDVQAFKDKAQEIEQALTDGTKLKTVKALLDELYAMYYSFNTMYILADIRSCQDVSDSYYAAEYDWCSDADYDMQETVDSVYYACAASKLGEKLEKEYFWDGFCDEYADSGESVYTDEYQQLVYRENELLSQYRSLAADTGIELDGREWTLEEYFTQEDADIQRGYEAYYEKNNPQIGEIYIELVNVRNEQAALLGYDSYAQMQYELSYDRDFSPEEGEQYIEAIKEYIVPVYKEIMEQDPYSSLSYEYVSDRELKWLLQSAAENMGGDIAEAFDFMKTYELWDVELRDNKANMSFQTYLQDYEAPFLFVDPYGDSEDIISVCHEFGHYVDAYVNYNAYETMDLAECFSQSMQYLGLTAMKDSLSDDEFENLMRMNLLGMLETFVQQASFAEFENCVYAADELSLEWINELSLELAQKYGYYDGVNDAYYSMSWVDTPHFFSAPYYVISYAVSAGVALEIYALELEESGAGLDKFCELVQRDGSGLREVTGAADLPDPLSDEQTQKAAALFARELLQKPFI